MNENNDIIEHFWSDCEAELQKYAAEFNNKMGVVGFQDEHRVFYKNPLG